MSPAPLHSPYAPQRNASIASQIEKPASSTPCFQCPHSNSRETWKHRDRCRIDRHCMHGLADPDACTHALLINFPVEKKSWFDRAGHVRDDELRPRKTGGTCSGAGARCGVPGEKLVEGRGGERAFLFVKASVGREGWWNGRLHAHERPRALPPSLTVFCAPGAARINQSG